MAVQQHPQQRKQHEQQHQPSLITGTPTFIAEEVTDGLLSRGYIPVSALPGMRITQGIPPILSQQRGTASLPRADLDESTSVHPDDACVNSLPALIASRGPSLDPAEGASGGNNECDEPAVQQFAIEWPLPDKVSTHSE